MIVKKGSCVDYILLEGMLQRRQPYSYMDEEGLSMNYIYFQATCYLFGCKNFDIMSDLWMSLWRDRRVLFLEYNLVGLYLTILLEDFVLHL